MNTDNKNLEKWRLILGGNEADGTNVTLSEDMVGQIKDIIFKRDLLNQTIMGKIKDN